MFGGERSEPPSALHSLLVCALSSSNCCHYHRRQFACLTQPEEPDTTDPWEFTEGDADGVSEDEEEAIRRDVMRIVEAEVHQEDESPRSCTADSDKENRQMASPSLDGEDSSFSIVSKSDNVSAVFIITTTTTITTIIVMITMTFIVDVFFFFLTIIIVVIIDLHHCHRRHHY